MLGRLGKMILGRKLFNPFPSTENRGFGPGHLPWRSPARKPDQIWLENLATLSLFYVRFFDCTPERWPYCAPFGRQPPLRSRRAVRTLSAKGPSSAVGAARPNVRPSDATPSSPFALGGGTGMWAACCVVLATPLPICHLGSYRRAPGERPGTQRDPRAETRTRGERELRARRRKTRGEQLSCVL